jgi:hypothetical protein
MNWKGCDLVRMAPNGIDLEGLELEMSMEDWLPVVHGH